MSDSGPSRSEEEGYYSIPLHFDRHPDGSAKGSATGYSKDSQGESEDSQEPFEDYDGEDEYQMIGGSTTDYPEDDQEMTTESHTSNSPFEIFSQEVVSTWTYVGAVTNGMDFPKLVMPDEIPNKPGVYRIFSPASNGCYVGEGKSLKFRLKKYENAKYVKGAAVAWTDRTVQGWIAEGLKSQESEFQIWCCSSAKIRNHKNDWVPLNLRQKYFRSLVEAITIAREPDDLHYINKQYENKNSLVADS